MRLTRELEDRKERVRVAQFEIRERTGRIGELLLTISIILGFTKALGSSSHCETEIWPVNIEAAIFWSYIWELVLLKAI